jgi:1-acyl-sn-glycerol-3-phosphate acyltransferase
VHFLEPVPATPDARRRMAELARERIALALEDKPNLDNRA